MMSELTESSQQVSDEIEVGPKDGIATDRDQSRDEKGRKIGVVQPRRDGTAHSTPVGREAAALRAGQPFVTVALRRARQD
jgi:hypothetical protein